MITALYFLGYILMLAVPIALGNWLYRTRGASWRFFMIGALTFVASQMFHIPFNWLVLDKLELLSKDTAVVSNLIILALFVGLSAGVFEEGARYLTYRYWATDARSWGRGMMLGAGHGGIEAILVAALGAINVGVLVLMRNGYLLDLIPPEQMHLLDAQIVAVFEVPWYQALLPLIERIFALCLHLSLSLIVLQVFIRGHLRWLGLAVVWHAFFNAVAVIAVQTWGIYVTEALLGVMALLSLGIIYGLYAPEPIEPQLEPLPTIEPPQLDPQRVSDDSLERSRYL